MTMVSVSTIICCVITLLICLLLPVLVLLLFANKCKKQGIIPAWLLGAAGFFVTQILIRVPILAVLQNKEWFVSFSRNSPFLYVFSLAFTAGLFELAGRFAVAKVMQKDLTFRRSLAAGLGHGGIEAIIIVGLTYVNNLLYIFMINTGIFETLYTQPGITEPIIAQLEMIRTQLTTYPAPMFLLGALERILAMTCHTAMSILVCYGIAHKKVTVCTIACLAIHTLLDLTAGISLLAGNGLSQTAVYIIIYTILTLAAVASLVIIRELVRRWNKPEVSYDSQV